jgi:hypothetical protein
VPGFFDVLHRFRHLGAPPGPPAAGLGVPARAGESLAGELLPVFTAVDAIVDDARSISDSALPEAQRAVAIGREQAERILEEGAARADEERAAVTTTAELRSQAELSRIAAEAECEVRRIAEVAGARRGALVARVVDRVRDVP